MNKLLLNLVFVGFISLPVLSIIIYYKIMTDSQAIGLIIAGFALILYFWQIYLYGKSKRYGK